MKNKIITICSSASFYKLVFEVEKQLKQQGFKVLIPATAYKMKKNGNFNVKHYKTWLINKNDYSRKTKLMDDHFKKVVTSDAILVINERKNGISGYIGGNVLMEMALAHYHKKKIFLWNDIPSKLSFEEEIRGVNPIVIQQNISKISYSFPEANRRNIKR